MKKNENNKTIMIIILVIIIIIGLGFLLNNKPIEQQNKNFVTIGTGGITGVYYPTGGAISKIINTKKNKYNIKASVESTAGSVYNINSVLSGELDFGIAQSDRQYQAYNGVAEWENNPQTNLRSVFSIYPESITLIVSEKSEINSINDLKNKKINLGNVGSGILQNSKDTLKAYNININDLNPKYIKPNEAVKLLINNQIDGFFHTIGHPSAIVKEISASNNNKIKIINIDGKNRDKLLNEYSYYAKSTIQKSLYPKLTNKNDIETFGVKATFVTSNKVSDEIVYAITKEIFENFEDFKKLHPAYSSITKESMLEGLSAPLHNGAIKYYKEVGLIK